MGNPGQGGFGAPPGGGPPPGGFGGPPGGAPPGGMGGPPGGAPPGGGFGGGPGTPPGGAPPGGGMGGPPPGGAPPGGGFGGAPMGAPPAPAKKGGCGKIILIIVIILVALGLIGGITTFIMCYVCASSLGTGGGDLTVGTPQTVTIWMTTQHMQAGGSDRPCQEYNLSITTPGTYLFTMEAIADGDAYVSVWRDGAEVGYDDDGGDGLNSRLEQQLEAGTYQVRACTFSPSDSGTVFTLNVVQQGGAAPAGGEQPAAGGGQPAAGGGQPAAGGGQPAAGGGATGCDGLAACCAANPPVPNAQVTCSQVENWRGLPAGAGETACTTALQGLRNAAQALNATMPAACQ